MIICTNCGRENADHYKFCLGCGAELAGSAPSGGKAGGRKAMPALGRPGSKLKLGGPLFGKGGKTGLSGLSKRLSTPKTGASDDQGIAPPPDEPAAETPKPASIDRAPLPTPSPAAEPVQASPVEAEPVEAAPVEAEPVEAEPVEATPAEAVPVPVAEAVPVEPEPAEIEPAEIEPARAEPVDAFEAADEPFEGDIGSPADSVEDEPFDGAIGDEDFEPVDVAPMAAEPAPPVAAPPVAAPAPVARAVAVEPARPAVARPIAPAPRREAAPPVFDDLDESVEMSPVSRACNACGAIVPDGFKFCGVCGTRYDAPQPAPAGQRAPQVQTTGAPSAHLVLIHPDGTEGDIFPLNPGETTVGRITPSPIFSEDPFLSPRHATFYFVQGQLYVRDESSLNGVFLRIRAEVELFHWDMFRIGQQLLRFEEMNQVRPVMPGSGDGTTVMGSPVRGTWGRLASVVALDTTTSVWALRKPEVFIGRERGDLVFPEDGFVSGSHCKVSMRRGRYFLGDLDSTNGTYLRIKGEGIVTRGDLLLLGQQLFKIELSR